MKKTITTLAVFALGASLAIAAPQAQNGTWQGHGHHRGMMSQKMAEKLNLTDAQKAQIRDLNKQFREQNKAFFESARATFKEYRAAKQANDTAKLQQLQPAVDANRAQMKQLREAQRAKIESVLTPEQRTQLEQWKAQHQSMHKQQK